MANFGILRDPQLAASFLGAFDQEQAKQAASKQQAFANDMAQRQFGLQEQTAAAAQGTARLSNAKMKQDIFKAYVNRVAAEPSEENAVRALMAYSKTTGDDVSPFAEQLRSFGGDPAKIRTWAVGAMGDPALLAPKYVPAGGRQVNTNTLVSAPDIQNTVSADKAFEYSPEAIEARGRIAEKGAPKNVIDISTGEKGFKNELAIKGDFKNEPVYKAHQEIQSAYSQIKQALGQQTPVGDLAGATKIMKLLDPGSVVRESELGMSMAATGLLDRAMNYATNVAQGTKLTPQQREEFSQLADALFSESAKQYNIKHGEYVGLSKRYKIDTTSLGNPAVVPEVKTGKASKGKVSVTAPDGSVIEFPSGAAAEAFKLKAGIK